MRKTACIGLGTSISTIALAIAAPASAQEATAPDGNAQSAFNDEIIVTAQRREENLQDVPLAITAINGAQLKAQGIETVIDLGGKVPGLNFQNFNGIILPYLRGVGTSSSIAGVESSVAVYVDGAYFSRLPSAFFDLSSVERVEVLKGPQGTLFGRNSTGGVINVVTRKPSYDTTFQASVGYGRFDAVNANAYVSTGLSDSAAISFGVSGKTSDGFGKNLATGSRYGFEDSVLVNGKLLLEPDTETEITLSGFYSWSKNSGNKAAFPGTSTISLGRLLNGGGGIRVDSDDIGFYDSLSNPNQIDRYETWGATLKMERDLGSVQLVSISAYSDLQEFGSFDDYLPITNEFLVEVDLGVGLFTQEIQLLSNNDGPFSWIVGAYYLHSDTGYTDKTTFFSPPLFGPGAVPAPASQKVESIAGFVQASYDFTPELTLTGGLRYTFDKTSAKGQFGTFVTPPDTTKLDKPSFKVALDYQATPDVLAYVLFARGFKSGGYNILTYNTPQATKAEELDDYEIGLKTELFDRRVRLNLSAFYYDITAPQVQLIANGTTFFSNAGASEVKGAEVELTAEITSQLRARLSGTYLDSKYTDYGVTDPVTGLCVAECAPASRPLEPLGGSFGLPGIDAAGNRTPLAAKWTFNLGIDYVVPIGDGKLSLTADWYHNSGYVFEPDQFLRQRAYDLVSAQAKYDLNENVAIRVWGRNLLDKKIIAGAASQLGNAGYPWSPAAPLTYGVAVDFSF